MSCDKIFYSRCVVLTFPQNNPTQKKSPRFQEDNCQIRQSIAHKIGLVCFYYNLQPKIPKLNEIAIIYASHLN